MKTCDTTALLSNIHNPICFTFLTIFLKIIQMIDPKKCSTVFDHERSFMSDKLHTLYGGVMV
jgi:hypothetical protein